MTRGETSELLKHPEGKTLEFKRDLSSLPPVIRTLVAFANTAGGTLLIGLDDAGQVRGLRDAKADEERVANAISESILPTLLPDIEVVHSGGKDILVVRVARWPGPFYVRREGGDRGVYVRLGSTNRRADENMREELERAARKSAFDELPCVGAEPDDLDMDAVTKAFAAVNHGVKDAELESLGLVVRYGENLIPSNGGIILFGTPDARRRHFDDARIRCARFAGSDKAEFLDRLDMDGSVLDAVDEVPKFIRRNTRMAAKIEGLRRQDIPEYPPISLREALVNAVVHTDYTQRGSQIMVSVFDDRMVIQNPGMMPFGMTLNDFKAGVSRIRNPVIARVFRELDLMEEWGSGYRRIQEDCLAGGYPVPEWQEMASVVRVEFRPHPTTPHGAAETTGSGAQSGAQVEAQVEAQVDRDILNACVKGPLSSAEIATALGHKQLSGNLRKALPRLKNAGLVEYTIPDKPTSRLQKYRLTEKGRNLLKSSESQ